MLPDIWHLKYLNFAIGVAHACSRINSIAEIPISKSADCTNRLIWHAVYRLITLQIHLKQTVPGIVFCVCVRGGGGGHWTGLCRAGQGIGQGYREALSSAGKYFWRITFHKILSNRALFTEQ